MPHQALLMKARQSRIDALASLGTRPRTCRKSRRPALFMSRRATLGSESLDRLFLRFDTFVTASPIN